MEQGFIDILKKLVQEQGHIALTDAKKCKALLSDYTGSEYRKERRLMQQAAEAGIAKAIAGAQDLASCKKAQVQELEEEFSLSPAAAADIVDALALVLRGDTSRTKAATQAASPKAAPKPAALPTDARWVRLIKARDVDLKKVPKAERSAAVCLAAVEQGCTVLKDLLDSEMTPEICLAAVRQGTGYDMYYVPESFKTPEFIREAVKQNGSVLAWVPEGLKTSEICLAAVKQHGSLLKDVPERLKTSEICLVAVKQDGSALKDVPESLKTLALCLAAAQNGGDLEHMPKRLKTPEFIREARLAAGWLCPPGDDLAEDDGKIVYSFFVEKDNHESVKNVMARYFIEALSTLENAGYKVIRHVGEQRASKQNH